MTNYHSIGHPIGHPIGHSIAQGATNQHVAAGTARRLPPGASPWRRASGFAVLAGLLWASGAMLGAAQADQHVWQGGPVAHPIDLTDWARCQSRKGVAELRQFDLQPSLPTFYIDGDVPSTASVSSARLDPPLPYRVTFWVRISQDRYNGFMIYDAADAAGQKTDIQVYLHDDRGDRTADTGWHGELWVKDAVGRYSVTTVPRGDWVKFDLERRNNGAVALFMDDRPVGSFAARSAQPMSRIVGIGDTMRSWWHGTASWGPVEISVPGRGATNWQPLR